MWRQRQNHSANARRMKVVRLRVESLEPRELLALDLTNNAWDISNDVSVQNYDLAYVYSLNPRTHVSYIRETIVNIKIKNVSHVDFVASKYFSPDIDFSQSIPSTVTPANSGGFASSTVTDSTMTQLFNWNPFAIDVGETHPFSHTSGKSLIPHYAAALA
jgi:hypothetical protein